MFFTSVLIHLEAAIGQSYLLHLLTFIAPSQGRFLPVLATRIVNAALLNNLYTECLRGSCCSSQVICERPVIYALPDVLPLQIA